MTTSYEEVAEYEAFYTSSYAFILWRKIFVRATRNVLYGLRGMYCTGYAECIVRATWNVLYGLHEIYILR
jgi:hypothetical protein